MTPTVSHIPVASLNCPGCDCGACAADVASSLEAIHGVLHVRIDRRQSAFVVRYDSSVVDESAFQNPVEASKIDCC